MRIFQTVLTIALMLLQSTNLSAAEAAAEGKRWLDEPWEFNARLHGWLPEAPVDIFVNGDKVATLPESVSTIIESAHFTVAGEFEANKGAFYGFVLPMYYNGRYHDHVTGPLGARRDLVVQEKLWLTDYGVGYELDPWNIGSDASPTTLTLTPYVGGRYFRDDFSMQLDPGLLGITLKSKTTVRINTPIIGVKANVKLSDSWSLDFWGDYGVANQDEVDKTYQVRALANYHWDWGGTDMQTFFGYRYLDLEVEDGALRLEIVAKGPIIGIGINF